jgi:hypothetical protein
VSLSNVDPSNWNSYVFLAAIVPAISSVYAATRFEETRSIVINSIRLSVMIFSTLAMVTAALLLINAW